MLIAPCKVCGNMEFDLLFNGKDRIHYLPGEFKLYRCRDCGLILVYPQLLDEELKSYYPDNYYSYENSNNITPRRSRKEKVAHYLRHPLQALN